MSNPQSKMIYVAVDADGGQKILTEGFSGTECQDASRTYEEIAGGEVIADEPTAEMHQSLGGEQEVTN